MPTGKGPLRIAIEDFLQGFGFGTKVAEWIKNRLEVYETEAISAYDLFLQTTGISDKVPQQLRPATLRGMIKHQIGLIVVLLPMVFSIIQRFTEMVISPFIRPVSYAAEGLAHSKHPDADVVLSMMLRNPQIKAQLQNFLPGTGYDEISLEGFKSLLVQYLTPFNYQSLRLRGILSDTQVDETLTKLGYQQQEINGVRELSNIIPSISDLIYLAVKEGFDDTLSSRFRHDEGFPGEVGEWGEKQGLKIEWAKRYWRAHWNLPSPQQVFEMLQRLRPDVSKNPVTDNDVELYLKMADYSPFWRDRLRDIAYSPFTRVDIRRMYKTRTLDEKGVFQSYLDIGYDKEHAQKLTDFTIAYEAEEETGIVRQSVITAYSDGMIDRAKASAMLKSGGYDDISIAFYLDSVDFNQQQDTNKVILNAIKAKFINGDLDETSVNNEINKLNLPSERTLALLQQWIIQRDNQIQQPTQTQVEKFVELGIATIEDYTRISKLRGYTDESIQWNIKRIQIEQQVQAAKDAADAAKEMERVLKDKDNSQYQVDKADIELAIAQAKEQITDIDIALQTESDPTQIEALGQSKLDLKAFIAQMNTAKAQLKYDFQSDKERLGSSNG